jgi:hypothetical protein
MPKFVVGQTVHRIQDNEPTTATVLEVIDRIFGAIYKIQYEEGATEGNDGMGYWPENCLA